MHKPQIKVPATYMRGEDFFIRNNVPVISYLYIQQAEWDCIPATPRTA